MTKQNACAVIIVILKSDDLKQFKEKLLLLLIRICITGTSHVARFSNEIQVLHYMKVLL